MKNGMSKSSIWIKRIRHGQKELACNNIHYGSPTSTEREGKEHNIDVEQRKTMKILKMRK